MTSATLADIRSRDWSFKLGAPGDVVQGLDDISQCIAIIVSTPKGTDPLRPDFAVDVTQFLDAPIDLVLPLIVRELSAALAKFEPRITVTSISAVPDQSGAHLTITIIWQLKTGGPQRQTAVSI